MDERGKVLVREMIEKVDERIHAFEERAVEREKQM